MWFKRVAIASVSAIVLAGVLWLAVGHAGNAPQGAPLLVYGYITNNGQPMANRVVRLHGSWEDNCHYDGSGNTWTTTTTQSGLYEFRGTVPIGKTYFYVVEDGCQDYCLRIPWNGTPVRQDFHLERGCW